MYNSIIAWNSFYVEWIRNGQNVIIVSYEELSDDDKLEISLKQIAKFLNFEVNMKRIACTIKYKQDTFGRKDICRVIPDNWRNLVGELENTVEVEELIVEGNKYSVFTKKHTAWINSAIRNVEKEMKKSNYNVPLISSYKNTQIYVDICL